MARKKRLSRVLDHAERRLAGVKAIHPELAMEGVSVASMEAARDALRGDLEAYNSLLSQVDEKLNRIVAGEKHLRDLCERALSGVLSKYGKDSDEYEKAGGKRKSERKKPTRKPKKP